MGARRATASWLQAGAGAVRPRGMHIAMLCRQALKVQPESYSCSQINLPGKEISSTSLTATRADGRSTRSTRPRNQAAAKPSSGLPATSQVSPTLKRMAPYTAARLQQGGRAGAFGRVQNYGGRRERPAAARWCGWPPRLDTTATARSRGVHRSDNEARCTRNASRAATARSLELLQLLTFGSGYADRRRRSQTNGGHWAWLPF